MSHTKHTSVGHPNIELRKIRDQYSDEILISNRQREIEVLKERSRLESAILKSQHENFLSGKDDQ